MRAPAEAFGYVRRHRTRRGAQVVAKSAIGFELLVQSYCNTCRPEFDRELIANQFTDGSCPHASETGNITAMQDSRT
jgi:hypothetical protein